MTERANFPKPGFGEETGLLPASFRGHRRAPPEGWSVGPDERPLAASGQTDLPLVSCIMVTGDRREFALQAVHYFRRQTYWPRELVIVDDGHDGLAACLSHDPYVRYMRVPGGLSVGEKRNRACELARGEFVAFWDDDDWYGPRRLQRQVIPLLEADHDVTALTDPVFFDLADWAFRRCSPDLHRQLFRENVHGGTLVFRRSVWTELTRFPDVSLAEDAQFLRAALSRGARLCPLPADGQFLYVRHDNNLWQAPADGQDWTPITEPRQFVADREFYLERRRVVQAARDVHNSLPDCLARTEITVPAASGPFERCLATVASEGFEHQLDDLLGSFVANGNCPGTLLAVFDVGESPQIEQVCRKYDAVRIACTPTARLNATVKSVLYSAARVIDAERFVCLDADMLVLGDLRPVFEAIGALPGGAVLACGEGNGPMYQNLRHALCTIYKGVREDVARLLGEDREEGRYPLVVNDGIFAGSAAALSELDLAIRRMANAPEWVDAEPRISWRNQFVFNLALAALRCGFELDPTFNVQLNYESCTPVVRDGLPSATWKGRAVNVLHFNGIGRGKYPHLRGIFARRGHRR